MADIRCSIQLAARKSGLSTHLIRMWQKRYNAVSPQRTDSNRRLYSDAEIERLKLLRAVVDAGHRIGDVAHLPDDDLRSLVPDRVAPAEAPETESVPSSKPDEAVRAAIAATLDLDTPRLNQVLAQASAAFGFRGSLRRFFAPFMHRVGDMWRDGALSAAHEHFASAAVRTFLLGSLRTFAVSGTPPVLVVATPAGQLHEVGAVLAAAEAGDLGWRVIFLGTSLPAAEIAGAVLQHHARAVALSIVYPPDDPQLSPELLQLRRALPADTQIIVGGRAVEHYAGLLEEIGASIVRDLRDLEVALEKARQRS